MASELSKFIEDELKSQGIHDDEEQRLLSNLRVKPLSVEQPLQSRTWSTKKKLLVGASLTIAILIAVVVASLVLKGKGARTTHDIEEQIKVDEQHHQNSPSPIPTIDDSAQTIPDLVPSPPLTIPGDEKSATVKSPSTNNDTNGDYDYDYDESSPSIETTPDAKKQAETETDVEVKSPDAETLPQPPAEKKSEENKEKEQIAAADYDEEYDYETQTPTPEKDGEPAPVPAKTKVDTKNSPVDAGKEGKVEKAADTKTKTPTKKEKEDDYASVDETIKEKDNDEYGDYDADYSAGKTKKKTDTKKGRRMLMKTTRTLRSLLL